MAEKRLSGTKFWLLGAAYWIVVAALLGLVARVWPQLAGSDVFFYGAIAAAGAGALTIVYLFQSKS